MPDHAMPTDFERRLAEELTRHAEVARDPRPTSLVAAEAMRLGPRRALHLPRLDSRFLILAAALIIPAALAVAGGALERDDPRGPDRVVLLRPAGDAVDVVLADSEGGERLLRSFTAQDLGLDPGWQLDGYGSVSQQGWLALGASRPLEGDPYGRTMTYEYVLVDLADPARAVFEVHGNGFSGPRWGPNGEFAVYCDYPPDCGTPRVREPSIASSGAARIIDPDSGPSSEVILHDVSLHGGGPQIMWVADGSGLLHHSGTSGYGVTPLDGGPPVPGAPRILSRTSYIDGTLLADVDGLAKRWYTDELAPATLVSERLSNDGQALWLLFEDSGSNRTLLVRMSGPGQVDDVHVLGVPAGTSPGFELSPEDSSVLLYVGAGEYPDYMYVLLPIPEAGAMAPERPIIRGLLAGFVPAVEADAWPLG